MKKLTTLFAVVALSTTMGLAGCKKKKPEEGKENPPAEKTTDTKPDDKAAKPDPAKPDQAKPDDKAAPAAASDLPAECNDYKAAIDKLASCDKMPKESRDGLKQAYDAASTGWASLTPEAKKNLATVCKTGADAVVSAAKTTCGW